MKIMKSESSLIHSIVVCPSQDGLKVGGVAPQ